MTSSLKHRIVLACSVVGNVLLATWIVRHHLLNNEPATRLAEPIPRVEAVETRHQSPWERLQNFPISAGFVSELRDYGFPDWAIHSLVQSRITESYAERLASIGKAMQNAPYWRSGYGGDMMFDQKSSAALRLIHTQIRAETIAQLKSLGVENDYVNSSAMKRRYGNLPAEKIMEIERITADYTDLAVQFRPTPGGVMLKEDQDKLDFLEREKRADIEKLLTRQELEAYDQRVSNSAYQLQFQLRFMDVSEDEYLKLYHLQKVFDDRFGPRGSMSRDVAEQRQRELSVLKEQFRAALGEKRFAEFELTSHNNYQQTHQFAQRMKLSSDVVPKLISLELKATETANAIRNDKTLTSETLAARMREHEVNTVGELSELVGETGLEAYRAQAGRWLRRIQPPPPRRSANDGEAKK